MPLSEWLISEAFRRAVWLVVGLADRLIACPVACTHVTPRIKALADDPTPLGTMAMFLKSAAHAGHQEEAQKRFTVHNSTHVYALWP